MCSWVGISLVLCLRGGLEWFAPGSIEVYHGSVWRKSPWTPRPLITKSIHVGWLTSFLIAWSHRNMSETWSLAISYFSFIPVLHVLSSLRPMRFGMLSEQCGGHSKATTKFYWVRSEGVDRFVVDWCWVDGFAGFSSFLKLGCACPVPGVLARMPTESRSLTTHHHAPSASVKCWVSICFCEPFCKRACCGHAGPKPKRNEIMQAGFWKGSVIMQSSDIYIYPFCRPKMWLVYIYICVIICIWYFLMFFAILILFHVQGSILLGGQKSTMHHVSS